MLLKRKKRDQRLMKEFLEKTLHHLIVYPNHLCEQWHGEQLTFWRIKLENHLGESAGSYVRSALGINDLYVGALPDQLADALERQMPAASRVIIPPVGVLANFNQLGWRMVCGSHS